MALASASLKCTIAARRRMTLAESWLGPTASDVAPKVTSALRLFVCQASEG
jgi:hypothetical protein